MISPAERRLVDEYYERHKDRNGVAIVEVEGSEPLALVPLYMVQTADARPSEVDDAD